MYDGLETSDVAKSTKEELNNAVHVQEAFQDASIKIQEVLHHFTILACDSFLPVLEFFLTCASRVSCGGESLEVRFPFVFKFRPLIEDLICFVS